MNEAFASYTTSTAFTLTLRKTHISALVYIEWRGRQSEPLIPRDTHTLHRLRYVPTNDPRSDFVVGANGLLRRGLVEHKMPTPDMQEAWSDIWWLTDAGRLVMGLLKEAGLWQVYAQLYPEKTTARKKPA